LDGLRAIAPVHAVWGNTDGFDLRRTRGCSANIEDSPRRGHGHQLVTDAGKPDRAVADAW
jgi:hypothetical protein